MGDFINRISELIIKYLNADLTDEEKQELDRWIARSEKEQELFSQLTDKKNVSEQLVRFYGYDTEAGWERIIGQYPLQETATIVRTGKFHWKRWAAAAIFVIGTSIGLYTIFSSKKNLPAEISKNNVEMLHDIVAPKTTKATITLADGRTVGLDSVANGKLAVQGNVSVMKVASGQIVYEDLQKTEHEPRFNTLVNPRGSNIVNLTLSDGTEVWLNAESSLHYPVAFSGKERTVEITGEAYFEVAKDPSKKFIVQSGNVFTEVFGTHFNVNAYANESNIKITLLEGRIKVSNKNAEGLLVPGQQAQASAGIEVLSNVDIDEVMAWKNGLFSFKGTDINTIMREVARWYDIDVEFKDKINEKFYGDLSRSTNASNLFRMIEATGGVHFKIEDKKVIVQK